MPSAVLLIAFLPDGDPDRSALQAEDFTDLVFQIALIREVEQAGIVAENNEVGGLGAGLGHVVDLQTAAFVRGRLHTGGGISQNGVQRTGGDTGVVLLVGF